MRNRFASLIVVFAAGFALGTAVVLLWTDLAMAPNQRPEQNEVLHVVELPPYKDMISAEVPIANQIIGSPLTVTGQARGTWFFEGSFPIVLVDWDGRIIAEHYAQAADEWMTEEYVPFSAVLTFENPAFPNSPQNHFSKRGAVILKKDNPSGLPDHDDALELPVWFE